MVDVGVVRDVGRGLAMKAGDCSEVPRLRRAKSEVAAARTPA